MFVRIELPADGRWVYEDPSGVPEAPLTTPHLPEALGPAARPVVVHPSTGLAAPAITKAA